jgi:hypothetical protein
MLEEIYGSNRRLHRFNVVVSFSNISLGGIQMRHFSGDLAGMRLLMADELERIPGGYGEDEDTGAPQDPPPAPVNAPAEFDSCWANFSNAHAYDGDWWLCTPNNPFGGGYNNSTGISTYTSPTAILAYNTVTGEYHNIAPGGAGAIVTIDRNGNFTGSGGA